VRAIAEQRITVTIRQETFDLNPGEQIDIELNSIQYPELG
jgi:hypothetical protein